MTFQAMTLGQVAAKYKVSKKTLKKWLAQFLPELKYAESCRTFSPDQVKKIYEACGEWEY